MTRDSVGGYSDEPTLKLTNQLSKRSQLIKL